MCGMQPGTAERVRRFARDHEASVNDVFLAALCRAMAPHLPRRRAKAAGRGMTLGTIVDTREDACEDLSESLGTFLGYYLVRTAADAAIGLGELSRRIAVVTRRKKQQRSYLDAAVNLRVCGAIWPRLEPESRPHFARRVLPLTAGVSNVHLRGTWIEQLAGRRILDFRRAASNGPALPLVVSPTTLREHMNVSVTYRVTGFSRARSAPSWVRSSSSWKRSTAGLRPDSQRGRFSGTLPIIVSTKLGRSPLAPPIQDVVL